MKKYLLVIFLGILAVSCTKETNVQRQDLPENAQQFIDQYFGLIDISYITKDNDSYDVHFVNGYEVDFTKKGEWEDVDCQMDAVPNGIVPANIQNYVNQNFVGQFIVKINKDRRKYDVELNNGLDLEFDKNGNFKKMDD